MAPFLLAEEVVERPQHISQLRLMPYKIEPTRMISNCSGISIRLRHSLINQVTPALCSSMLLLRRAWTEKDFTVCIPSCPGDNIDLYTNFEPTDDYSDSIIINVASKCSNTIVVIHNAGIRLVDTWIEHPNITAVLFGHLPGQDAGRAIVSLLFGDESPSGKMPYTVAKNESDYNVPVARPSEEFFYFPQDNFTEGVYIDYRDFDRRNITPRYEFGFGLTYTTFEYSNLSVSLVQNASTSYNAPESPIVEGGPESLWDVIATTTAVVTNTGDTAAKEVAQLYVHIPGGPIRQLRGFNKVEIQPGESANMHFTLTRRDLSDWNVAEQAWVLQQGTYSIWMGPSSRILPLNAELVVGQ